MLRAPATAGLGGERHQALHSRTRIWPTSSSCSSPPARGDARGPKKRITCFLVDRGTPGFEIRPGYDSVSHRGYHNCILTFDDCRLPDGQVLGEAHRGFELANEWLYATRITVAASCVGRARRVFDLALAHAAERRQFGQPIGRFQGSRSSSRT